MAHKDSTSSSDLIRTWKQGPVRYIQLNRPKKANAYNEAILDLFAKVLDQTETDTEVRVVVMCGAGNRTFCVGADLNEMRGKDYRTALNLKSARLFATIASLPKVTLAAINGAAAGGGLELALACDIRIAVPEARFFLPETALGLIPAAGGTQRLPKIVGVAKAKELILGGRVWQGEDALRFGLVSEVVKHEELLSRAQEWGEEIAKRSPLALQLAKKAMDSQPPGAMGYSFESVAEALLYQLRLTDRDS
jgi:enoyl-CoA hydratase/carnithine racemase